MPYLIRVKLDGAVTEQWELSVTRPFIVGRGQDVHGQIADSESSRHHFHIIFKDGKYWVEDKNSRNGTFVNGTRQAAAELKFNDRIRAGETQFFFVEQKRTDMTGATIQLPALDQPAPMGTMVNVRLPKVLKKK